ncbi:hypothetical protein N9L47_02285 [Rhodobacteraceae bacterium]|nr:hypothetical protein [Paracoccaceae bacterium]
MKPITDEFIYSLIKRAERCHKPSRAANDIGLASKSTKGARIISLDTVRPRNRIRKTVSGVFFYARS